MMVDVSHLGQETLAPDQYLGPRRYRITYACHRCGHQFKRTTTKLDGKDPPCPKRECKDAIYREDVERAARNFAKMIEEGIPPGHIGDKPIVKAVDATANIVMEDHHLTNLKDNIRMGEAMAPSLPPEQQRAADNFFNPQALAARGLGSRRMQRLAHAAIHGGLRGMAINPNAVLGAKPGEAAPMSRPVRYEKLG